MCPCWWRSNGFYKQWSTSQNAYPGRGADPHFCLTKIISYQTFQTEINPDQQTFHTQATSDQTFQTQRVSDQTFQNEGVLIRSSSDHGPDSNSDHCPDLNQTMIRLKCEAFMIARSIIYGQTEARSKPILIRPKCARIRLWPDFSDQIDLWSDHLQTIVQTVVRSKFRPDPVILVWEHTGVRSAGSDHEPIWAWTWTCAVGGLHTQLGLISWFWLSDTNNVRKTWGVSLKKLRA